MARKRVAIVGSGCSGLGALWALKSTDHDVHLFEADEVLGGHTNTVTFKHGDHKTNVDTGFIVYNTATYPNFIKFLDTLDVETVPTEMTFGVTRDNGAFEWAGTSLSSVFAQRGNLFSLSMWRLLFDVVRFNQYAPDLLRQEDESTEDPSGANGASKKNPKSKPRNLESIGEYLEREGYSDTFREDYLIPMTAAVWSTDPDKAALDFPAITLVRFMWNHHLLSTVAARPQWRTIKGGSQKYIEAVLKDFPRDKVHLSSPVVAVEDINDKLIVQFENDEEDLFDHVILACHGDQAAAIISDGGTEEERTILGGFQTTENIAVLHSDLKYMPRNRRAWAAWNLITQSPNVSTTSPARRVSLTYNMNILQHIPSKTYGDVLVTLNPSPYPPASSIQGTWEYHHPVYDAHAIRSQRLLTRIQNTRGISYCGAWTKYGFHEDGFASGVRVAVEHLGAVLPWEFVDATFSRGKKPPRLGVVDWFVRIGVWYIRLLILILEFVFGVVFWPLGVGRYAKARQRQWKKLE